MTQRLAYVLVPGAWMGAWIWDDTVARLREEGHACRALTLQGLHAGSDPADLGAVTLADHVAEVTAAIDALGAAPVVLVGHSYSGTVVGQAADQRPRAVIASVHLGSFLPRHGHSLLDDWGTDADARAEEKQQVRDDAMTWAPPPAEMLEAEDDLTTEQRRWLADRLVPHPGRTVLDPVSLSSPVTEQVVTYVADVADDLAPELTDGPPLRWRLKVIGGGHWPMLTRPDEVHAALLSALG